MRVIDPKFHIDGDKIIKTSNGQEIPPDEPLFLLRARDRLAVPLLKVYAALSEVDGCNEEHMRSVIERLSQFIDFAATKPERMKQPGVTRGK